MANSPIVFSSEEQLKLQDLENQINGFTGFKNLVTRSLYAGQDSALAAQLLNFLSDLITQSMNQVNQIRTNAQERANAPKEEAVTVAAPVAKEQ